MFPSWRVRTESSCYGCRREEKCDSGSKLGPFVPACGTSASRIVIVVTMHLTRTCRTLLPGTSRLRRCLAKTGGLAFTSAKHCSGCKPERRTYEFGVVVNQPVHCLPIKDESCTMIQSEWLSTIAMPQSKTIDDNHREGRRRFRATLLGGCAQDMSAVPNLSTEIADLEQSIREEKDSKCDEILFIGDVYVGLHVVELEQRRSCGEMVFRRLLGSSDSLLHFRCFLCRGSSEGREPPTMARRASRFCGEACVRLRRTYLSRGDRASRRGLH